MAQKRTAATQRNEKLVLYLFTRNCMQIFERCLDIKSRENFHFLKVLKSSHIHLKTQEWKMDVNDKKTAQLLVSFTWQAKNGENKKIEMQTIRKKPLTARKRTRQDKTKDMRRRVLFKLALGYNS
ncbi:hypothetical protein T12_3320 [Trichinella patagoniensis]|uniref:Uncharacterized protein n=1 Tax=Trichinella patagoniensis TaxID=990121 RepID=A0A0V0ZVW1_9BILA|nr:hypothetical protein T12_3320 [Trichinella patagoniensis]